MDFFARAAAALAKVEHLVASEAPQYQEIVAIVKATQEAVGHLVAGLTSPAPSTDPNWPHADTEEHHG